MDSAVNEFEV